MHAYGEREPDREGYRVNGSSKIHDTGYLTIWVDNQATRGS